MNSQKQKAYFALGCFWGPQQFFSKLEGVVETRVGYTGGTKENPTYTALGDHTETLEVVFDPALVSYEQLLGHFWKQHDPTTKEKTQYRSVIFYADKEQQKLAEKSKEEQEEQLGRELTTTLEPIETFYEAEEYHQRYLDKLKDT